jgi:hypothetical protein
MARTWKDKKPRFRKEVNSYSGAWQGSWHLLRDIRIKNLHPWHHSQPKLRKEQDYEDHWMTTPGWWVRMFMTKPQRVRMNRELRAAVKAADLEEVDVVDLKRKPHVYYY